MLNERVSCMQRDDSKIKLLVFHKKRGAIARCTPIRLNLSFIQSSKVIFQGSYLGMNP